MATYVVSDLHGQFDTFEEGLQKIGLGDDDSLILIGDAIDRGPEGIKILRYIMDHDNMDMLIGNHEYMMLNSVDPGGKDKCSGPDAQLWLFYNGGITTLDEYLKLSDKERLELLVWLNDRCVIKTIDIGCTVFCLTHSYYIPGLENRRYQDMDYDDVGKIVWTSVYRTDPDTMGGFLYDKYDYTFVTGHVPTQRVRGRLDDPGFNVLKTYEDRNLIDIDGGCAMGYCDGINNGALFLRLDDMEVFPIPVKN